MQPLQLLALLAPGAPLSGAALAERSGVTRAAIWKQVEALRARGVPVLARGRAGYCLPWPVQLLDAQRIRAALPADVARALGALEVHDELDSTSSELQRRLAGAADLSVVLAESVSRIGLRNGINTGLPTLVCPGITAFVDEGEELEVDITSGVVKNTSRGTTLQAQAWPEDSPPYQILLAGGFMNYFKQRVAERSTTSS